MDDTLVVDRDVARPQGEVQDSVSYRVVGKGSGTRAICLQSRASAPRERWRKKQQGIRIDGMA